MSEKLLAVIIRFTFSSKVFKIMIMLNNVVYNNFACREVILILIITEECADILDAAGVISGLCELLAPAAVLFVHPYQLDSALFLLVDTFLSLLVFLGEDYVPLLLQLCPPPCLQLNRIELHSHSIGGALLDTQDLLMVQQKESSYIGHDQLK